MHTITPPPVVDGAFAKATAAGCTVNMPLGDQFWGDRYGQVRVAGGDAEAAGGAVREGPRGLGKRLLTGLWKNQRWLPLPYGSRFCKAL
jgi:hypothetical protein